MRPGSHAAHFFARTTDCKKSVVGAFIVLLVCFWLAGCSGNSGLVAWHGPNFSVLAKNYGPAVVNIGVVRDVSAGTSSSRATDDGSLGSGFIVSKDGFILTNAHVVAQGNQISVKLTDRREFKARLIGVDQVADIALLKIDAKELPTVRIGNPDKSQVGDWALAIGSPYGFSNSATAGIISAKRRILPGTEYMPFLQTDVPVNPGNSGGPLFNAEGEVIGINSRIYSNSGGYQGLSFAIPIDVAMRIKEQLQVQGNVTRGRIGIAVQEVSQALSNSFQLPKPQGALISYVERGAAASRAGLKSGDVIMEIAGREVVQSADALIYIADLRPGEKSSLKLWRDRVALSIDIVPDRFDLPSVPKTAVRSQAASPLGLIVRSLFPQEQQVLAISQGLLVQQVNSAALRAGVKSGDVILAVNGQSVGTIEALIDEVGNGENVVALLLQRGSSRIFVPIDIQKPTVSAGD